MIRETISPEAARRFYDRLGQRKDRSERFESKAKARALALLDAAPGQRVLNVGVGTGGEHARLHEAVAPGGVAVGIDISRVMLELTRTRTGTPLCEADARALPFAPAGFDRLFSSYVLDLIPLADVPGVLRDFHRILKPGGRMVLVSMTEGVDVASRVVIAGWRLVYAVNPVACGGCRPLRLSGLVWQAGFEPVAREVVVQSGFPSEVIVATR